MAASAIAVGATMIEVRLTAAAAERRRGPAAGRSLDAGHSTCIANVAPTNVTAMHGDADQDRPKTHGSPNHARKISRPDRI